MGEKILVRLQIFIFVSLFLVNLANAFVPETAFDALWYHLTLPKLWLSNHRWFFPGGLLYYSGMPRLAETIFIPALATLGYVGPKLIQLLAGLFVCLAIFKLTTLLKFKKLFRLLAINLFYATWLVSWQSSSGYIDLIRTALEVWAFYFLFTNKKLLSGILFGLALSVKWQALTSLAIAALFSPLVLIPAFIVFSPWIYLAIHFTGNPLYPLNEKFMIDTQLSQVQTDFYHPAQIIKRFISAPIFFTRPFDGFLTPLAGLMLIFSLPTLLSSAKLIRKIAFIAIAGAVILLLTPPPSIRYYLPYFPFLVIAATYLISRFRSDISIKLVYLFTFSCLIILAGRLFVTYRNLPFLLGQQSENEYLTNKSSKIPETFIDSDGFVKNNLPENASYLISNLHELYYFPYAFDHVSWADPAKHYDYLISKDVDPATQPGILIHTNSLGIQIFKL